MLILAITLMAIGSFGVGAAVLMEIKHRERKWAIMMKVFPLVWAIGATLFAIWWI